MKLLFFALLLPVLVAGCVHQSAPKSMKDIRWHSLMIQNEQHGTFTPQALLLIAKEYLKQHKIVVDNDDPIIEVYVCNPKRMGVVRFWQGPDRMRAVEIGPDATAVRDYEMKFAR